MRLKGCGLSVQTPGAEEEEAKERGTPLAKASRLGAIVDDDDLANDRV